MIPLDKLDTIDLGDRAALDRLLAWRDVNIGLVRNFRPVLFEGVIKFGAYRQYFKSEGNTIYIQSFLQDNRGALPLFIATFRRREDAMCEATFQEFSDRYPALMTTPKDEAIQDSLTIYCSLMAYMENYTEVKDRVQSVKHTDFREKKPKHGKKNKRVVRASRTIYTVNVPETQSMEGETRTYERHAESWGVKGHWRTYKSGNRVWVEQHTKGKGDREPKDYRV